MKLATIFTTKVIVFTVFCIAIILLGAGNHFWYEQSNESAGVKWFAAVNESAYEHMKLIMWPWLFCSALLLGLYILKVKKIKEFYNNHSSSMLGLYTSMAIIPALFYLYTEGFGVEHNLTADIIIYVIAVIVGTIVWAFLIRYKVPNVYDLFIFFSLYITTVIWVFSCAYAPGGCQNIYDEPEHSH